VIAITSLDDPRIAPYHHVADPRAIARANLFVAEGRWVVERLLSRPRYNVHSVLVTPTAGAALARVVDAAALVRQPIYVVDQPVMDGIVGFNIHRGCLALAERPPVNTLAAMSLATLTRVLVLEGVNNPDNVGGIFRSASAFGIDLVVLGPGCGDPLYRKAIRTSMASSFDVPYASSGEWPEALDTLRRAGLQVIALTPEVNAVALETMPPSDRIALLVGTEGAGLTAAALSHADVRVRIAMSDRVDSLNATVAASIAMHHFAR
jgi:tRNA G18 (ribose-2'-O)-methylase SpoU